MHTENFIVIAVMIAGSLMWGALRHSVMLLYKRIDDRLDNMRTEVSRDLELLENERKRIANDLHDDVGTLLSAISIRINCLDIQKEKDQQHLELVHQYIDQAMQRIRNISHNLTPQTLIREGLDPALREFLNQYKDVTNTSIEYVYEVKTVIPPHKSLQLYRMIQELVHNGLRHSKATRIQLCLFEKARKIHLLYSDDGVGFMLDKVSDKKGLGLSSLKNRTEILAGKMKLRASPGKGVEYYFTFPP